MHSKTEVVLGGGVPLLCVSPQHGKHPYMCELQPFRTWEKIDVSSTCCVLFVSHSGRYRCTIGTDTVTFTVQGNYVFMHE